MKANIKQLLSALVFVPVFAFAVGAAWIALPADGAVALSAKDGAEAAKTDEQQDVDTNSLFKDVTNTLLYIIGGVSVIMIVFGGFRYIISNGDSNQVTAAKNTILYAVVGLVVALVAYAIVNFVLTDIFK
jgi:cytochrome bd-type quinol oxidase subunit 2